MSAVLTSSHTFHQATGIWCGLRSTLSLWRQRARERRELALLSARDLKDLGMTQGSARFEASKPFWRA